MTVAISSLTVMILSKDSFPEYQKTSLVFSNIGALGVDEVSVVSVEEPRDVFL